MDEVIKSAGTVEHLPDAAGVIGALQRIGYSLEASIADLIDNSIDAKASSILLRFLRSEEKLRSLLIVDDGHGMSERRLDEAMTFGRQTGKNETELGKYGMGLKSASFSQCDSLTVFTRRQRKVAAQRWTVEGIREGWVCERLDPRAAAKYLNTDWGGAVNTSQRGTIVRWDRLDAFAVAAGRADDVLETLITRLDHHVGMHFHRFLSMSKLKIFVDTQDVDTGLLGPQHRIDPLDPFSYPTTGRKEYPRKYICDVRDVGRLTLAAHIWPPRSKLPGYRLGGGRVSRRQGFYFYRNDRLIQAGGWNGYRDDAEPHASLARVTVDLPAAFDEAFALNVQKTALVVPVGFFDALDQAKSGTHPFSRYLTDAIETYRTRDTRAKTGVAFVPNGGVSPKLRAVIRNTVVDPGTEVRTMAFRWEKLADDQFFEVRPETGEIVLNAKWRNQVLQGKRPSKNDAPVVKALLYLLLRDELGRERMREESRRWLEMCQEILMKAVNNE